MKLPPMRETPAQVRFREDVRNDPLRMPDRLTKSPWERFKFEAVGMTGSTLIILSPLFFLALAIFIGYELLHWQ